MSGYYTFTVPVTNQTYLNNITNYVTQDHHIIPQGIANSDPVLQLLQNSIDPSTGQPYFNVNDPLNIIPLPQSQGDAAQLGVSPHNGGPLASYQNGIKGFLSDLANSDAYQIATDPNSDPAAQAAAKTELSNEVSDFTDATGAGLANGDVYTNTPASSTGVDPNAENSEFFGTDPETGVPNWQNYGQDNAGEISQINQEQESSQGLADAGEGNLDDAVDTAVNDTGVPTTEPTGSTGLADAFAVDSSAGLVSAGLEALGVLGLGLLAYQVGTQIGTAINQYNSGDYSGAESTLANLAGELAGGLAGAEVGGEAGAALGSLAGPIGILIGGAIGAGLGFFAGAQAGEAAASGLMGFLNGLSGALDNALNDLLGLPGDLANALENLFHARHDPLVIDLTGAGIKVEDSSVADTPYFDFSGSGYATKTSWIGTGNGFLVIKSTNQALGISIGNGYELLGTGSEDGFSILESLDTSGNGAINASEAAYSQLYIWQDLNGDGVAQPDEISSLEQLGITSISLSTTQIDTTIGSSTITQVSSVTFANGMTNKIAEVNLGYNPTETQYVGTFSEDQQIAELPNVKGYGDVANLAIQMSLDPTLADMVQNLVDSPPNTIGGFDSAIQNIMYQWAGVESVSPASGNIFDGQKVDFLADYTQYSTPFSTNPSAGPLPWFIGQAISMNGSWNAVFDMIEAQFLVQMPDSALASNFTYSPLAGDTILPNTYDLATTIQNIAASAPNDPMDALTFWIQALVVINQSASDITRIQNAFGAAYVAYNIDSGTQALFAAGTSSYFSADILNAVAVGDLTYVEMSALNNVVYGTQGTDLFDVTQSNMTIEGFGGGDEIVVNPGVANLNINEVENNPSNSNELFFAPGINEANVVVTADASGDIILTYDAQGDQVTLDSMLDGPTSGSEQGPLHTSLPYTPSTEFGVQEVVFSDGTTWTAQQVIDMLQDNGSPTNTTIYAGTEAATLDPAGYANLIVSQGGADTILFNEGYSDLTIDQTDTTGFQQSVLQFGSGISFGEIQASGDASGDLILTLGTTGTQITLDGMAASASDGVAEAVFADGTTLTASQLLADEETGSPVNTVLYANVDTSLLDPNGYAHAVVGAGSGDTIVYDEGYGDLAISQSNGSPVLAFGSGVSEANVVVSQDGQGDIILTDLATGATIDLTGMASNGSEISAATFSDGTTWSAAQILEMGDTGNIYNQTLYEEAGSNVFDPNGYAHDVQGNSNGYTVLYNLGDGNLTVSSSAYAGILQFGAGIFASDISLSTTGDGAVVLTVGSTGSQITLANQLYGSGVDEITFTDGTTWSLQQILAMADTGSATNTVLYGEPNNDPVIDPAGFAHVISLWGPSSTILYNVGYGKLTIVAGGEYVPTTLAVGPGITAADISVTNLDVNPDPQYQWSGFFALNIGTQAAEIVIDNFYGSGYAPGFGQIDFSDGTTLSAAQIADLANTGNPLNTTLIGTSRLYSLSDNLFDPKGYAHEVITSGEPSTILYDTGYGALQVFGDGNTTIEFGAGITESEITVVQNNNDVFIVNVGTGSDQIMLENGANIGAIDFADGTTWSETTLLQLADTGSYQGQTLTPDASTNVFDPNGYASEILSTLSGSDTILYNQGYGSLTVDVNTESYSPYWWAPWYDKQYYPNGDVLQFGTGITASEISAVQEVSGDLILDVGGTVDVITLVDMLSDPSSSGMTSIQQYGVASAVFADGSTLTAQQLIQLSEVGSAENDPTLSSPFAGTTFYANGYVSEVNGVGGDTIVYSGSTGNLVVKEGDLGGLPSTAVLQLAAGISEADVQVAADANGDVILQIGSDANQITLTGMNYALSGVADNYEGVGSIVFADGTTWTSSSIAAMLEIGSAFNNSLYAYDGGETFDSKGIATSIQDVDENYGDQTPSTFLYNAGYGALTIAAGSDWYYEETQDILQFGAGIDASAVAVSGDASGDIVLTDGVPGDTIVLQGMLTSANQGVADVVFADGTSWSSQQILAMEDVGSPQGTTLYAGYESNVFDPNGFAHFIVDDNESTILYNEGYGNLEIKPVVEYIGGSGASGSSIEVVGDDVSSGSGYYLQDNSTLAFGTGISLSDLSFSLNSQGDVVVNVAPDNAGITLDNALEVGVPSFVFADGTTLASDQIIADAEANPITTTTTTGPGTVSTGGGYGVSVASYSAITVTGVISVFNGYGISAANYSTILNDGTISASNNEGVSLHWGGQITNNGVIYGADGGIYQFLSPDSIILNSGSIIAGTGTNSAQSFLRGSGISAYSTVVNYATGLISGTQYGVLLWGNNPSVSNAGSIGATSGTGVELQGVGNVYNSGIITGGVSGAGVAFAASGTLVDSGSIYGGTAAVSFGSGDSRLVVEPGAVFSGQVIAEGTGNVLELAAGVAGTLDMGGSFSGFQTIQIDAGAAWTLEGTNTELVAGQTITGFTNGDTIELLGVGTVSGGAYAGASFSNLSLYLNGQGAVIVSIGTADAQMTLDSASQVVAPSFVFTDGTTLTSDQIIADLGGNPVAVTTSGSISVSSENTITGSAGDTNLFAYSGDNIFVPNGFAHSVTDTAGGADTILYSAADGNLQVNEATPTGAEQTVLQFDSSVPEANVAISIDAYGDVILSLSSTGATITLDGMAESPSDGVGSVTFADGTTWTAAQILSAEQTGTLGETALYGGYGQGTLDPAGFVHTVDGEAGDNIILYSAGDGNLLINAANPAGAEQTVLQFDSSVSEEDVTISDDANGDVILSLSSTGAEITLQGMADGPDTGVGSVTFSDGTTWTAVQILSAEQTGTFGEGALYGGYGQSTLNPGGFVHTVDGGSWANTILYKAGDGDLKINETASANQQSVLQFGSGISASQIEVVGDAAGDIILTVAGLGTQITLSGMLANSFAGVGSLVFADGTSLIATQLVAMAETGSPVNSTLYGNAYGIVLEPDGPVHLIDIGMQADSIDYEAGDGNLTVNGSYATGNGQAGDVLAFGTGISASELSASAPDGKDLILTIGTSGSQITLSNMLVASQVINSGETLNYGVSEITFADGTTLSPTQVIALLNTGSHLNTTLSAGGGDNTLDPAGYAHVIDGNGGTDTILYNRGYGNLLINEQNAAGPEQSILELGSAIAVADIVISGDAHGDILLTDTVTGAKITLANMLESGANGIAYGVGSVEFDSTGTMLTAAQLIADAETGAPLNTTLYAGAGNTTFQTGGYAQSVNGNGGADTILYTPTEGNLQINEYDPDGPEQSVLQFGSGISATDLSIATDGYGDVIVQLGTTGDEIGLTNMLSGTQYGVGSFAFADGTTLSAAQIEAGLATIAAASTTLYSTLSSETLDTKGYFSAIQGNGGADTIIYDPGYGNLSITEQSYPDPEQSVLQFGTGISEADVAVSQDQNGDIILGIGSPAAEITLVGMLESDLNGVAAVEFSDGTTWTAAQVIAMTETGSPDHTTLVGGPGNNVFNPNGYAHVIDGNGGADTILFNLGDGRVTVNEENQTGPEQSVLQFGTGITVADISASQDAYGDIILTVGTAGDAVVLSNMIDSGLDGISFGVGSATFVDGTTLSVQQITNLAETGSATNTVLRAGPDGDTIDPNGYASLVLGGAGANIILYNQGYGALTIDEQASGTEASVLQFGSGISAADLSATTDAAGDIILTVGGTGDQITLTSMANSLSFGIGEALFADGTTLSAAQLDTLAAETTLASTFTGLATSIATTDETAVTPFASLSVADLNSGSPAETITVALSDSANGALYDPNSQTDGAVNANGILTITGSAADVSSILDALVFTPTSHQVAPGDSVVTTLNLTDVNSAGVTASAAATITATAVEDAPVINGAATGQIATDKASLQPFANVVISDPDVGANDTVTISVTGANGLPTDANGTLSGTGLTEISAGVYTLVAGAPPSLTAELDELIFTPAAYQVTPGGTVTTGFTITVAQNELVTTNTATSIFATATNDPAVIAGTQAGQAVTDEAKLDPFSGVTISDPDLGVTETAVITLTGSTGLATDADGTLSGSGLTKIGVGVYSLAAANPAGLTAELDGLTFSPTAHQVAPGQTVATGFTLAVTQDGVTTTDTITSVFATAANDAPVISGAVAGQAMSDEASVKPFSGVAITDLDVGVADSVLITLSGTSGVATDADGTLFGTGLTKIGTGLYTLTAASPASLTAELEALTFSPTAHQVSPGSTVVTDLSLSVTQNGATTVNTASSVIVTAANDAPVLSGTKSGQTTTDMANVDPFSGVTISDPDVGVADSLLITLSGTSGVATDADGALSGSGLVKLGTGLYSLAAASPASLTAELEALTFSPTPHQVTAGSTIVTDFALAVTQNGLTTTNTVTSVIVTAAGTTLVSGGTLYAEQTGTTLNTGGTLHVINGGSFANTILYNAGYGALTIEDANPAGAEQSILQFGSGISEGVLKVSADAAGDILFKDGIAGDTITLMGMDTSLDDGVGFVQFPDGTEWTGAELVALATLQSVPDYSLAAGVGAKTISGAGVFVVGAGIAKNDVVFESNNGNGNLTIALLGANGQLTGDSITITGYWWNEKGQATVLFPDGSSLAVGNQVLNTWVGSTSQTTLTGSNFAPNLFDLGPGGDTISLGATYNGGNGQNTLEFGYGDGAAIVTPNGASATIAFGANITPSQVIFQSNSSGNLTAELLNAAGQPSGDSVTINGYWWNTSGTNIAVFANGTTLALNHSLTDTWIGTTTQTTLVGSNFAPNQFDLGAGGDTVTLGASYNGGNGDNTLEFGYGDGAVTVVPNQGSATIALGASILPSEVIFQSNNNNGNLTVELLNAAGQPTGDSLTIDGYWWNSTGTNVAVFANGTTLALNHQLTDTWIGSATQTVLAGSNFSPNVFDLGAGGDHVTLGANYNGGNGQNIVNFGTGDGAATISGYGGTATISLAAGISMASVSLSTDSSGDIILALSDGVDKLTIAGGMYSGAFQQLDFANGTTLSQSQILYTAETGTTGNDTISLPAGTEVVDGRGGNDVINGGGGYDSYVYRQGYGNLTINNAASGTVATGELDFGSGITEQNLWFSRSGNNLDINVLGSTSQIAIDNWYGSNPAAQVSEIKGFDGLEIDTGLNQLVAAMAVFEAGNPGFNPETAIQMPNDPSLQAAIAASWHAAA